MEKAVSSEMVFLVEKDVEGGYVASAEDPGITTQAESLDELRNMIREAVDCYFDDEDPRRPQTICMRVVHEEVFTAK